MTNGGSGPKSGSGPKNAPAPKIGKAESSLIDVRKKIRDRLAMAEEAKKLDLQRQRIILAGKGVNAYTDRNLVEAAQSFRAYIKVLEDLKGVPSGGLSPAHFDKKTDVPEMMLISGVYWDLVKLFDRTRSAERYSDFKSYLAKYIQFSRGMPYQTMSAETMRKYIKANRPVHKNDMKEAYKQIATSKCFIATELAEYTSSGTIGSLQNFRDEVLKASAPGRGFVTWYYRNGPDWADWVSTFPKPAKQVAGRGLDVVALLVKNRSRSHRVK